jgi:hypothetical protein
VPALKPVREMLCVVMSVGSVEVAPYEVVVP